MEQGIRIRGIILILILLFNVSEINAQSCLPDGIFFTTQSQVDSFQINYPGCTEIEGSVTIYGDDITNLDELTVLTSIGHYLKIYNTSSLGNLHGLNHVVSIGGDLIIEENDLLNNLSGLIGLVHIDGSLIIKENQSLTSLFGLNNLTTIGWNLNIGTNYYWTGNPLLTNLSGLQSLSSIGNSLTILFNHGLTDLSGIENLSSVEELYISSNDNLLSLNGLQGITNIDGYIRISWGDALISLDGLNNLSSAGNLSLYRLPCLDDLSGFDKLKSITNDLTIKSNFSITSIASFDSLNYIGGNLTIESNGSLIDLSGFYNLTEIAGDFVLYSNYDLISIASLSSLTTIGGDLYIRGNSDLTNLDGMSGVLSIGGDLTIIGNSISSLSGIQNIDPSSIENLHISYVNSLTDCAYPNICEYIESPNGIVDIFHNGYPCNSPVQIANECGVSLPCLPYGNYHFYYQSEIDNFQADYPGCTDLNGSVFLHGGSGGGGDYTNLDGLSVITSIDSIFSIYGAYLLTSLSGIDSIDGTSISDLVISNCPFLSECEVQSICDYLANPNGQTIIEDNAEGCNSPEEVSDACETVNITEQVNSNILFTYPNPFTTSTTIQYELTEATYIQMTIYNHLGEAVEEAVSAYKLPGVHAYEWNAKRLSKGMYFAVLSSGDGMSVVKLIKQ